MESLWQDGGQLAAPTPTWGTPEPPRSPGYDDFLWKSGFSGVLKPLVEDPADEESNPQTLLSEGESQTPSPPPSPPLLSSPSPLLSSGEAEDPQDLGTTPRISRPPELSADAFVSVNRASGWNAATTRALMQKASSEDIEQQLTKQCLYKTELCRSFEETTKCRYGAKCQFAHGRAELRPVLRHPKYKTEICKTFQSTGSCPYSTRCRFIHLVPEESGIKIAEAPAPASPPPSGASPAAPTTPEGEGSRRPRRSKRRSSRRGSGIHKDGHSSDSQSSSNISAQDSAEPVPTSSDLLSSAPSTPEHEQKSRLSFFQQLVPQ